MTSIEIYAICATVAGLFLGLGWRKAHSVLKSLAVLDADEFMALRPLLRKTLGMEDTK